MSIRTLVVAFIFLASVSIAHAQVCTCEGSGVKSKTESKVKFSWGAELGCGIDISGHDMSDINLNAFMGLKTPGVQFLGVGAGVDMVMGNSCRSYPIVAVCRTSFGFTNPICFADIRVGCAFNNVEDSPHTSSDFYFAPGLGVNLASGKNYRSYITLSYIYNDLKYEATEGSELGRIRGLSYANVAIGISF